MISSTAGQCYRGVEMTYDSPEFLDKRGNWQQTANILSRLLREHLSVTPEFERVRRVRKSSEKQPRGTEAKFLRFCDREPLKEANIPETVFGNFKLARARRGEAS
ncbi:uncharacterized protein LOC119576034 [Penaeus monodon]|uniref:uncharacterized protein LOC119576034 n=1 Tax=Penaeus monodon TaxID=6687 RepID=UPI0018A75352|nr:uncharacterized protein LOC119576034 [Penaeus monodon]